MRPCDFLSQLPDDSVFWYQIDEGDKDIASFFYYLGLHGESIKKTQQVFLPFLTAEYLEGGINTFARNFFAYCSKNFMMTVRSFLIITKMDKTPSLTPSCCLQHMNSYPNNEFSY